MEIKGIELNSNYEIIINKSKFFAYSFVVNNLQEIDEHLNFLKQKYSDATHICYAYSIYPNKEKSIWSFITITFI